jgi:hypothetical protein
MICEYLGAWKYEAVGGASPNRNHFKINEINLVVFGQRNLEYVLLVLAASWLEIIQEGIFNINLFLGGWYYG